MSSNPFGYFTLFDASYGNGMNLNWIEPVSDPISNFSVNPPLVYRYIYLYKSVSDMYVCEILRKWPMSDYFCVLRHSHCTIEYTFRENEKWDFVLIIVQFMMSANSRIRYGLQIVFVCLYITPSHYHHCANLSVDIEQYMGLYLFNSLAMVERIYCFVLLSSSNRKYELLSIVWG